MILNALSYLHPEKRTMTTHSVDHRRCVLHCSSSEAARMLSTDMHRLRPLPEDSSPEGPLTLALPGYSTVRLDYGRPANPPEAESLFPEEGQFDSEVASSQTGIPPFPSGRDLFHLSLGDAIQAQAEGEPLLAVELAPLIDTGDKSRSLSEAVHALDEMAVSLGRGNRPGTFLTTLKEKTHRLAAEKKEACAERPELLSLATALKESRERMDTLELRRQELQQQVDDLTRQGLDRVESQISDLEAKRDSLDSARRLDSDQMAELNRMTTLVETARRQLEKTTMELEVIRDEIKLLPGTSSEERTPPPTFPNALERVMRQLVGKIAENEARLEEIFQQIQKEDELIAQAQSEINALPDFSRISASPIDLLNQLLQSFKSAMSSQEREAQRCVRLEDELEHLQRLWDTDGPVFEQAGDFTAVMVENQQKRKAAKARYPQVSEEVEEKQNLRDEKLDFQKGQQWIAIGCFILTCAALAAFFIRGNPPLLLVAAAVFGSFLIFFLQAVFAHRQVQRLNQIIAEDHGELDLLQATMEHKDTHIEELMVRLGCQTPRELEARYDRHKELSKKIRITAEELAQEQALLAESEERIPALLERLCETLSQVDEMPESAAAMDSCVTSAIAKYHRHKDLKRNLTDRQNLRQTLFARKSYFETEKNNCQKKYDQHEEELRTLMREAGFSQESLYSELDDLCTNFRSYLEDAESSLDKSDLLARQKQKLEERLENEKEQQSRYEKQREELLEKLDFPSLEIAREAGELGAEFRTIQKEIEELRAQKDRYLQGTTRVNGELLLPEELAAEEGEGPLRQLSSTLSRVEKEYTATRQQWLDGWTRYSRLTTEERLPGIIDEELTCTHSSLETAQQLISAGALTVSLIQEALLTGRPERCGRIAAKASELLQSIQCDVLVQLSITPEGRACIATEVTADQEEPAPLLIYTAVKIAAALVLAGEEKRRQFIVDAALQQQTPPLESQDFYGLLEALPAHWQTLVVTENAELAEAGAARGWASESL